MEIDLSEMEREIDSQVLLSEEYKGNEKDMAAVLTQIYYNKLMGVVQRDGHEATNLVRTKILVNAKWLATKRLTQEFPGLVDRASMFILDDAQRNGWHHALEYDTVEELLASMYDASEPGTSTHRDYRFIVEDLLPAARSMNVNTSALIQNAVQVKKLRGATPAFRLLLQKHKEKEISDKETKETLKWLFDLVGNEEEYEAVKPKIDQWRGKVVAEAKPILGGKFEAGEKTIYLIIADNRLERTTVENVTRNIVDYDLSIKDFEEIARIMFGKL